MAKTVEEVINNSVEIEERDWFETPLRLSIYEQEDNKWIAYWCEKKKGQVQWLVSEKAIHSLMNETEWDFGIIFYDRETDQYAIADHNTTVELLNSVELVDGYWCILDDSIDVNGAWEEIVDIIGILLGV